MVKTCIQNAERKNSKGGLELSSDRYKKCEKTEDQMVKPEHAALLNPGRAEEEEKQWTNSPDCINKDDCNSSQVEWIYGRSWKIEV